MTTYPPIPPLHEFQPHKVIERLDLDGYELPLHGAFYRRAQASVVESVAVYSYAGRELFAAWGEVGRRACSFHAVRRDEQGWHATRRGCPVLRPLLEEATVAGVTILTPEGPRVMRFAEIIRRPHALGDRGQAPADRTSPSRDVAEGVLDPQPVVDRAVREIF